MSASANTTERSRSRRIDSQSELQTLVNSLTLDQLRFGLQRLSQNKKIAIRRHAEAIDALARTGASVQDIASELLRIESLSLTKHCLVCSCLAGFETLPVPGVDVVDTGGIQFKISRTEISDEVVSITFEHTVPVRNWKEDAPGRKSIEEMQLRHPIVLRYLVPHGAALFYFPGFYQGDGVRKSDRITYEFVLGSLVSGLQKKWRIKLGVVPIESAVGVLSETENDRIKVIKSDVEGSLGRIGVSARASTTLSNSVEDVIAEVVASHLPIQFEKDVLKKAIGKSFRELPANSLVVHWQKEEFFSRINFWTFGAEFYFIWHKTGQSIAKAESVIGDLFSITKQLIDPTKRGAWESVAQMAPLSLILPGNFAANYSLTLDQVSEFFSKAISAGLVTAVYRIRTLELLDERNNDWTSQLSVLRGIFHTESGGEIDGGDPANIEVAFQRVGHVKVNV